MEWTWSPSLILALIGLLAGGISTWVMINNKVTKLEADMENMKRAQSEHHNMITSGFESLRTEMKSDISEIRDLLIRTLQKNQ